MPGSDANRSAFPKARVVALAECGSLCVKAGPNRTEDCEEVPR